MLPEYYHTSSSGPIIGAAIVIFAKGQDSASHSAR
jgi:hypothetical protein